MSGLGSEQACLLRLARTVLVALGLILALQLGCSSGCLFMYVVDRSTILSVVQAGAPNLATRPVPDPPEAPPSPVPNAAPLPTSAVEPTSTTTPPATATMVVPLATATPYPTDTAVPTPTCTPTPSPTPRPVNLVIIIWDGTQRAHLLEMLDAGQLPHLRALIDQTGRLHFPYIDSATCQPGSGDGYRTETGPANSAIATGLGYPGTANWNNTDPHPIPDGLTLWERLKALGYTTGFVSSKAQPFWPLPPLSNARPEIDHWRVRHESQSWVTDHALEFLRTYAGGPFFLWIHYKEPDTEGHRVGENSSSYSESLVVDDQQLGQITSGLRALGIDDDTLLVVATDHGFDEGGLQHESCGPDTRELFLATSSKGASLFGCVVTQTDIAPCVTLLLLP